MNTISAGKIKKTILVVDDNALCREPIAEALRRHGYDVVCAVDGVKAIESLRRQPPDLVLLDVNMPGVDGFGVLRLIRRDPALIGIPVIMLTDRGEREDVVRAAAQKPQGYLLKSAFTLDDLFARVGACLGESKKEQVAQDRHLDGEGSPHHVHDNDTSNAQSLEDLSPIIAKEELLQVVCEGLELKPLGLSVQNVIAVTGSARCSADDVARAVTQDQALSIRVLKLANSSAYSRGRLVTSVKEAVARIGIREVRSLVMTLGVLQQYENAADERLDARLFWEHSIACGLIASAISKELHIARPEDCFLWGMVHDVGRLILLDHVPEIYNQTCDTAERLSLPLEVLEAKLMHLDHCHVLDNALAHWQFPNDFRLPVVSHHLSEEKIERLKPEHSRASAVVALANRIAHACLLGGSGNDVLRPFDTLVEMLQLRPSTIAALEKSIDDEARDLKFTMLAQTNDGDWPDFRLQVKQQLAFEVRPKCISNEPEIDAFRLFFERIAATSNDQPANLGVIYCKDGNEFPNLIKKFDSVRQPQSDANTPAVLIVANGGLETDHPWLASRRYTVLTPPIRISKLVTSIRRMFE